MLLTELNLKNYKLHANRKIEFIGNLIGIVGPNGSGKSNLLGGIHYCLAGEHPGFKKEDLLRWGADEGHAKLSLTNHGETCTISRGVGTSSAAMTYGSEEYRGITKVAGGITTHLGLDRDLLRQTIFARQAEIDAVLFTDPRDRELAFQRLCGLAEATKIHKKLGEILGVINAVPDYAQEIVEAKTQYADISARLKQLESSAAQSQTLRAKIANTTILQAQLQAYAAILPVLERMGANLVENADYSEQINDAKTQLALYSTGTTNLQQLDAEVQALRKALSDAQDYARLEQAWKAAGLALVNHGEAPTASEPPFTAEAVQKLADDLRAAQVVVSGSTANLGLYTGLQDAVKALEDSAECPVCGNTLEDTSFVDTSVERISKKLEEQHTTADKLHKTHTATEQAMAEHVRQYEQAVTEWRTQHISLLAQYNVADVAMKDHPSVGAPNDDSADILTEQLRISEARYQEAVSGVAEVAKLNAQLKSAEEHLARLNTELADLSARISDLSDVSEALANDGYAGAQEYVVDRQTQQQKAVEYAQALDQQLAELNGMITELTNTGNQINKTIGELEFKQAQQSDLRAAVVVIGEVRDWFHYNNGPKTLSSSVLQDMTATVNDFLGQLGAPFTAVNNDRALGFNCVFHDGRVMPEEGMMDAHHLSGGQRMQLAIAFRLASYCMFAGRLGLLSLDEPTTYLDDANIGHFCSLLPKLKEVAKSMDLQILIATHAKEVLPHMDTVVNLYPQDE